MKVLYIGLLIPDTLPKIIVYVVKVSDISLLRLATLPQVIADIVDVGQVLPGTLPLVITEDMLI